MFGVHHGFANPGYLALTTEALAITFPDFDEKRITQSPLTHGEAALVNMMAIHYENTNDPNGFRRSVDIRKQLIANTDSFCADETEKETRYAALMFNHSSCLGSLRRWNKAMETIELGQHFERSHDRLAMLPSLIFNKAYVLFNGDKTGGKEKNAPYWALAYYGMSIFAEYGEAARLAAAWEYIRDKVGIILE